MLAIVAAVLFAIAIIMDLADAALGIGVSTVVTAGLLCLALHLAGIGASSRNGNRRWSLRR
ncbi:hypothetical protein [Actinokineospora sp.]|uniref:hypothetical protein n=1 Tax=Actinokineospora sp. TaxID=1872133 RepID=UPI004037B8B4